MDMYKAHLEQKSKVNKVQVYLLDCYIDYTGLRIKHY